MKRQIVLLSLGRLFGAGVQAVIVLLTARLVPIPIFGQLSTVLSAGLVLTAVGDLGVSTLLARARALEQNELVLGCLRLNWLSSFFAAMIFVVFLVAVHVQNYFAAFVILTLALVLEKNTDCALAIPIADDDRTIPTLSIVLRRAVTLAIFISLLLCGADTIFSYAVSYLVGSIAGQLHLARVVYRGFDRESEPAGLGYTLKAALPFFVSNTSAQVRLADVSLVASVAGAIGAGLYAGATRLTSPFSLIAGVVTTVMMPYAAKRSRAENRRIANKLFMSAIIFAVALVPLALFSTQIIVLVLGARYAASGPVLAWCLLALPPIFLSSPLGSILQATGHERFVAYNGALFALVTVGGILVGALGYGPVGAAIGVVLTYSTKCVFLLARVYTLLTEEAGRT